MRPCAVGPLPRSRVTLRTVVLYADTQCCKYAAENADSKKSPPPLFGGRSDSEQLPMWPPALKQTESVPRSVPIHLLAVPVRGWARSGGCVAQICTEEEAVAMAGECGQRARAPLLDTCTVQYLYVSESTIGTLRTSVYLLAARRTLVYHGGDGSRCAARLSICQW
jgi:hypothetical protein